MKRRLPLFCFFALLVALLLAGCGGGDNSGGASTVSGVAATGAPLVGTVYLKDSSTPAKELSDTIDADGSFSFNIDGLKPPFILKAQGTVASSNYTLYSFSSGPGITNINPFANLAVANAAESADLASLYAAPTVATMQSIAANLARAVTDIQTKLQPLLIAYSATANPISGSYTTNHLGLDGVLDMVKVDISATGTITLTNKLTNAIIYTGSISNFTNGTLTSANIPQPPMVISVTPATATVERNHTATFTTSVFNSTNTQVIWSVVEAGGGTITSFGVYTAPSTEGTYHVKATSVADPTKSATATVAVTGGPVSVTISPSPATVTVNGMNTFTATVTGTSNTQVTWSVIETSGGSITSAGVYTAPGTAGTYHVTAVSAADPTKSATATTNVTALLVGTAKWKYTLSDSAQVPAVGNDGTIYLHTWDGYLYAITSNGAFKWKYFLTNDLSDSAPTVGTDGTIYVCSGAELFAINPNGILKWKYHSFGAIDNSSPAIGTDGTIYVGSYGYLHAIYPNGTNKWVFHEPYPIWSDSYPDFRWSSPAIGSDGTIYIGSKDDSAGGLYAINSDGTLKWIRGTLVTTSPSIGNDDTIYYVNRPSVPGATGAELRAITPAGTTMWSFQLASNWFGNPSIGGDGTIYVGGNGDFYALALNGSFKWKYHTGFISDGYYPTVGQDGNIYIGTYSGLYVLKPDGTLNWKYNGGTSESAPVISNDGTIYVTDSTLYAISSDCIGLANSTWPKFHHDNQNTGKKQ